MKYTIHLKDGTTIECNKWFPMQGAGIFYFNDEEADNKGMKLVDGTTVPVDAGFANAEMVSHIRIN